MSVYFLENTEKYRCDTEDEADMLIDEAKKNGFFDVAKFTNIVKTKKEEEYRIVTITKKFTTEKDPDRQVIISYEE